jgi:hypothetical protein
LARLRHGLICDRKIKKGVITLSSKPTIEYLQTSISNMGEISPTSLTKIIS